MEVNASRSLSTDFEDMIQEIRSNATSHIMYKIATEVLDKIYFPILVPVGVVGNFLSFLVMIQPHNRHMSFSLYISALAVTDTVALLKGFISYLNQVHKISMPPNFSWHCKIGTTILFTATLGSTLFILSMTFERFYSIIMPHKAASFNTVKRAKITIAFIVVFSTLYNFPHVFIKSDLGLQCVPYLGVLHKVSGKFYQLFNFTINSVLPFLLLLIMNSVIIHTLRMRSKWTRKSLDCKSRGEENKTKSLEMNIYITLLLVSFMFIFLTFPVISFTTSLMFFDYTKTATRQAVYYLFYHIGQKAFYTNNGINFFLYVASGKKFRGDLLNLFRKRQRAETSKESESTEITAISQHK